MTGRTESRAVAVFLAATAAIAALALRSTAQARRQDEVRLTVARARGAPYGLRLVASGILWQDSFHEGLRTLKQRYAFNGSAPRSDRFVVLRRGTLGVGVVGRPSRFEGYFAVTRSAFPRGSLTVVQMEPTVTPLASGQRAESLVAVQTATTIYSGAIDYVFASMTQTGHQYQMQLGYANGYIRNAKSHFLRRIRLHERHRPRLETIAVRTGGRHHLAVWLSGLGWVRMTSVAPMNIQPPYQVYLETQSLGVRHAAWFHDLTVYRSADLTIESLPRGSAVSLVAGQQAESVIASPHGTAVLPLAAPAFSVGGATLRIRTRQGRSFVLPFGPNRIVAGTVYRWTRI